MMNTTESKSNSPYSGSDDIKQKKSWVKPDIEIISKDTIHSGSNQSYLEGQPTTYGGFGSHS